MDTISSSLPKASLTHPNYGSSITKTSDPLNQIGREYRKHTFTAVNRHPSPNGYEEIKYEEQDKSLWSYLKNKLKPKRRGKGVIANYVEPNFDRHPILVSRNLPYKQEPSYAHFVDYNFLRVPKPLHKETKFRASTIDTRRLNPRSLPTQTLLRPRRQDRLLTPERIQRSRFLYLCEGTANRIDHWLAESERYMKADNYVPPATAGMGFHQTQYANQTPRSSRNLNRKTLEFSDDAKIKAHACGDIKRQKSSRLHEASECSTAAQPIQTNLFRQSSRSANHLPVLRKRVDTYSNFSKCIPSPNDCYDMTAHIMPFNQGTNCIQKSSELKFAQDNPTFTNSFKDKSQVPVTDRTDRLSFKSVKSFIDDENTIQQNSALQSKMSEPDIPKAGMNQQPLSRASSLGESHFSTSSMSLNGLSCNESYCTDYTPQAFGEQFTIPATKSSSLDPYEKETFSSNCSESGEDKIQSENFELSKIPAKNNLLMRRRLTSKNDQQSQMAKFVTTIYLTNDELNLDNFSTSYMTKDSKLNFHEPKEQVGNIEKHISSLYRTRPDRYFHRLSGFQPIANKRCITRISTTEPAVIDTENNIPSNIHSIIKMGSEVSSIILSEASEDKHSNTESIKTGSKDTKAINIHPVINSKQHSEIEPHNSWIHGGQQTHPRNLERISTIPGNNLHTPLLRGNEILTDKSEICQNMDCDSKREFGVDDDVVFETSSHRARERKQPNATAIVHPYTEKRSPPLNSFTSKSNLSLFEEIDDSPLRSPLRSPQRNFSHDENITDAQRQFSESHNSSLRGNIQHPSDSTFVNNRLRDHKFDVHAFMSVKHDDHARIFDLCFGDSPSFNKSIALLENEESIPDWKIMETSHCKDARPFRNSARQPDNKSNHISAFHSFNHARAFFV